MKNVVIIGAGPAGLTAAYQLLKKSKEYQVTILEEEQLVGGISKTVCYDGNRMDLGGHRFFTKDDEIMKLWCDILPIGKPIKEKVLLERPRVSRIFYNGKFFDYPVNLSFKTIRSLGIKDTIIAGFSYLKTLFHKLPEDNLENFYINRFGKKLYEIFFKDYTTKLWGIEPKEIDSSWGSQRVKGISIRKVLSDYFHRLFKIKNKHQETSLIDKFYYPKYGPGMMYEEISKKIEKMGGTIFLDSKVKKIHQKDKKIDYVVYYKNGKMIKITCDYLISTMPIKDLIIGMNNVPNKVYNISSHLPYRDFITIGVILDRINVSDKKNNLIPDTWIYVQSKKERLGRIQVFNNWSEYLLKDKKTISLGLEYFCQENDDFWKKSNDELLEIAIAELKDMKIIDSKTKILNYHVERVKKAYPAYFGTYKDFSLVREYLDEISNLYCIGRNGMHRYNNMDHSMKTAILCANNIIDNITDKKEIWDVNTEEEYHEVKNEKNNK